MNNGGIFMRKNVLKRIFCGILACLSVVVCTTTTFATETEFDISQFQGLFEPIDENSDVPYNVIGETGVVQGGSSMQNKNGTVITVNVDMPSNNVLLQASNVMYLSLYKDTQFLAEFDVDIVDGTVETIAGLEDGIYNYKITLNKNIIKLESLEGAVSVQNGKANIVITALPICTLYVVNSGEGTTKYTFANDPNTLRDTNTNETFAVVPKKQYKIRAEGVTNYTTLQIPAMAETYTYDLATKQVIVDNDNTQNIEDVTKDPAQQPAVLPPEYSSEDNPFNIAPTNEINDTDNIKANTRTTDAEKQAIIMMIVFTAIIAFTVDTVCATDTIKNK